ncbi:hypothetical protein K461DRAFT_314445, partial [Myriangium duriaei CBS 260.36]
MMIYDLVWERYNRRDRFCDMEGSLDGADCDCEWWEDGRSYPKLGASPTLWALARTCKEIHEAVLPLVYKGVTFGAGCAFCAIGYISLTEFVDFMHKAHVDLIIQLSFECSIGHGMSKRFAKFMKVIAHGRYLKTLSVTFGFFDSSGALWPLEEAAELGILCLYWQTLLVKGKIIIRFCGDMWGEPEKELKEKLQTMEEQRLRKVSDRSSLSGPADAIMLNIVEWAEAD